MNSGKHSGLILLLMVIAVALFALACGGGGGATTADSSSSGSSAGKLKTLLKPAALYKVQEGDSMSIIEIGGDRHVALEATALSETVVQELEVDFELGKTYAVVIYSHGIPFVRTTVFASQLEAAKEGGVLKVGSINAITTYFTGLLEVEVNGARSAAGKIVDVENLAKSMLSENFTTGVLNFSDLTYSNVVNGSATKTDAFRLRMNRINTLTIYLEWVGSLTKAPTATETGAMTDLFGAIFDENNANNLLSKLASPALPAKPSKIDAATGLASSNAFMTELVSSGLLLDDNGVLSNNELESLFFEPENNAQLALIALESPDAILSGQVIGSKAEGVRMDLRQVGAADPSLSISKSVFTDSSGGYTFGNLPDGNYEISPSLNGYVFNPPSVSTSLSKSQNKAGFNFDSFLFVQGSLEVPLPKNVLLGIEYTSSDGSTKLTGSMQEAHGSYIGVTTAPGIVIQFQ